MIQILMNPTANNGKGSDAGEILEGIFKNSEINITNITKINNVAEFVSSFGKNDIIIVSGGDGTMSRFASDVYNLNLQQQIFLYPCGSGNDFLRDVRERAKIENKLVSLNEFIKELPKVTVKGITRYFINGIGFGIDGYCCEEGDKVRATSTKPVNYTNIAIGGLLGKYHPANAEITVDGVTKTYNRVWLAPTMLGRYYGGGMMITPSQDRLNKEKTVSSAVWYGTGKLGILPKFPSVFKGEHVKYTKSFEIRTGHEVKVVFDRPQALQIDGETITDVTSYSVSYK